MATLQVVGSDREVADAAANETIAALRAGIEARGQAHLALAGGTTPAALYALLTESHRDALDWQRVHCWLGDDRFVPRDDQLSNAALARRGFRLDATDGSGLPVQFTPFATDEALAAGNDPSPAAEDYARRLESALPSEQGLPSFDVVLIGIGPDGHILSVFPEHDLVPEDLPVVYTTPAPQAVSPHVPRLTINPRLLPVAGRVILLAVGESKAEPLARALRPGAGGPTAWGAGENALWILDQAAASRLER